MTRTLKVHETDIKSINYKSKDRCMKTDFVKVNLLYNR